MKHLKSLWTIILTAIFSIFANDTITPTTTTSHFTPQQSQVVNQNVHQKHSLHRAHFGTFKPLRAFRY